MKKDQGRGDAAMGEDDQGQAWREIREGPLTDLPGF
jgi:hypothetical protein